MIFLCSVIVLTYNSQKEKIIKTLDSIIDQEFERLEIIISDDGSKNDYFEDIQEYFNKKAFSNYQLIKNEKNVGTVKNFYEAIEQARGKYIKAIGPGDYLYDNNVLYHMCTYMESNSKKIAFGLLQAFNICENKLVYYPVPFDIDSFYNKNMKKIQRNIIVFGKYISGASLFYEREFILQSMQEMQDKVIYCEDLVQVLALVKKEDIGFINRNVIWYEFGSGISTSKNNNVSNKLRIDEKNFFEYLNDKYEKNNYINRGIRKRKWNNYPKLLRLVLRNLTEPAYLFIYLKTKHQWKKGKYKGENFIDVL